MFDDGHEYVSQINALIAGVKKLNHPCESCEEKPCLSACPVGAFSGERLDVESCFSHLDGHSEPACMSLGCQARVACPIASDRQNDIAQIQFHMKSYRGYIASIIRVCGFFWFVHYLDRSQQRVC